MEISSVELTYINLSKSAVRYAVTASGMIAMFCRCEGMLIDCIRSNIPQVSYNIDITRSLYVYAIHDESITCTDH